MYNITLILTRHEECGSCNSTALHHIIKEIEPEIIFEELSWANFDRCYNQQSLITLETSAVKMYLRDHDVKHVPVDTFLLPESYDDKVDGMYGKIFSNNRIIASGQIRDLVDNRMLTLCEDGFSYLNGIQNDIFFERFNILKQSILDTINDKNLHEIHQLEKETVERREYEILDNIYKYSRNNAYNQALLFIGSGHRQTIVKLIQKYQDEQELKLNWTTYGA